MTPLAAYLFPFLVASVPLADHSYYENIETTRDRYESIAETIAWVSIEAPVFEDDESGVRTGALLASIATYEGSLKAEIDTCAKGGDIDKNGVAHAWTLWQVHAEKEKACASRVAGATIAREMIRISFKTCKSRAMLDRLSIYTDGSCHSNWKRSRHRMGRAMNWVALHPFTDE